MTRESGEPALAGADQYWPYPQIVAAPRRPIFLIRGWRRLARRPTEGPHTEPLNDDDKPEGRWGISLSGGGVRAASFSLGVVQEMHRHTMIHGPQGATYLSAVSGGSYLAGGMAMVTAGPEIKSPPGDPDEGNIRAAGRELPAYGVGSPEERLLRTRTRYLTHGSGGPLAVAWRYLLGALLNLVLVALTLWAIFLPIGWIYGALLPELRTHGKVSASPSTYLALHKYDTPGWLLTALAALAALGVLFGLLWVLARWEKRSLNGIFGGASFALLGLAGAIWVAAVGVPHVLDFVRVTLPRHGVGFIPSQARAVAVA